jgi:hypothetical protein
VAHKLYVRGVYDDLYRIERKYDEHPDGTRTPVYDALLGPIFTSTKVRSSSSSSGAGYERGKAAGKGINLSRQVGGSSSKALGG